MPHLSDIHSTMAVHTTTAAVIFCCIVAAAAALSSLPAKHPQNVAPSALLSRIARSNPASLTGAEPSRPGSGPSRPPFLPGLRVTPSVFGGDPTGRKDSWAALNACLSHCLNQSALSPNGFFPGQASTPSFGPIRDMGGCDIDLEGGEYVWHLYTPPVSPCSPLFVPG